MDALKIAQSRHTAKAYDPSKKISKHDLDTLLEILRLSPSSINIQPWHFIVAQSDEAKQKIADAMPDRYAYNIPKVINASEVIIFTAKQHINNDHVELVTNIEDDYGRFRTPESKQVQYTTRQNYIDLYKTQNIDRWIDSQLHIALGSALLAAKSLNIDATPIGGFDLALLDQNFDLQAQGLRSVVLLSLGYSSDEDFNADLPKARLAKEQVIQIV